ncbi:hypothetical protein Tco_0932649 [Tanacetum coccineum]
MVETPCVHTLENNETNVNRNEIVFAASQDVPIVQSANIGGTSPLVSPTAHLPPHQSNVDVAAIFRVLLTTVGELEVLIKDIDAGKHEELLSRMTNDKRKVVIDVLGVPPPNWVAAEYRLGVVLHRSITQDIYKNYH